MKTAHVFSYRFPRLREGLFYEETIAWYVDDVPAPPGSYVLMCNNWFTKPMKAPSHKDTWRAVPVSKWAGVYPDQVPKEIRAMALLLT